MCTAVFKHTQLTLLRMFIWQLDSNSSVGRHRAVAREHEMHKSELCVIQSVGIYLSLTPAGMIRVQSTITRDNTHTDNTS